MDTVLNTFIWAAMIQGLFLGLIYFFSKKHRSAANRLLGLFLFAFVLEGFTFVPLQNIGDYATNSYFQLPEVKLLFPVLFLHYILEKLGRAERYRIFLYVHYLLGFAFLGITAVNVMMFVIRGNTLYDVMSFSTVEKVFMSMQFYAYGLTALCIGMAIRECKAYRTMVKQTYSDLGMLQIRWLWQLIFGVIPIVMAWGIELTSILVRGYSTDNFASMTWLAVIVFIYFLSFKAYQKANLIAGPIEPLTIKDNSITRAEEVASRDYSGLSAQLETFMTSKSFYRRQDLTIYDLARAVDHSPRLISECVNRVFQTNFTDWVNNYRVEEAKAMLEDPASQHLSVEGIGSEAGFKSRSAMYAAFKKKTGHSPGHFRS